MILSISLISILFVSCSGSNGGGSDPAPQEEQDPGGTTGGTDGGTTGGNTEGGTETGGTTTGGTSGGSTTGGTTGGTTTGGTSGGTTTGETSGGTTGGGSSRNLFSLWLNVSDNFYLLDFEGMNFNTTAYKRFSEKDGSTCTCGVLISGSQTEGIIDIFSCSRANNQPPGCLKWQNNGHPYEYTKNSDNLILCIDPETCATFR